MDTDLDGERVHVGAERDEGGRARANISDDARSCDGASADSEALELLADEGAGSVLPERELRVRVDSAPHAHHPFPIRPRAPQQLLPVLCRRDVGEKQEE